MSVTFSREATFLKVEESLGLILGFAIVCEVDGEPYFDLGEVQEDGSVIRDHVLPEAMLKAATDFMKNSRLATIMHERDEDDLPVKGGDVVFAFPMTAEIAAALDITTKRTGLMIAMKPDNPEDLAKARDGVYRGFSIGGARIRDEAVE